MVTARQCCSAGGGGVVARLLCLFLLLSLVTFTDPSTPPQSWSQKVRRDHDLNDNTCRQESCWGSGSIGEWVLLPAVLVGLGVADTGGVLSRL